jgi:hypothetical protein
MSEEFPKEKESFEQRIKRERKEWSEKIQEFSVMIKHLEKLADLQVEIFSSMARLADYRRGLSSTYSKQERRCDQRSC